MKRYKIILATVSLAILFCNSCQSDHQKYQPIDLSAFADVIKHWNDRTGGQGDRHYRPDQIIEIGDNLLAYQRSNGGWPTNVNPVRVLSEPEREQILLEKDRLNTSFDNRNTYPQIEYLAHVFRQTRLPRFKHAVLAGLEFVLDSQYPNGGWPHSPPTTDGYRAHITFMDEVMPGVLGFLRKVASGEKPFDIIDQEMQRRVKAAIEKGDALVLKLQIIMDGKPTVWAGQYDRHTLKPVTARSYELPGLVSWESVAVVRYLMSIEEPGEEVIFAIESTINWFESAKIEGIRIERVPTKPIKFEYYTSTYDLHVVADADAPPIWARFYDLKTGRPFFANRDGSVVHSLAEVKRERRTGYDWYGYWPAPLLEKDYPAWKRRERFYK